MSGSEVYSYGNSLVLEAIFHERYTLSSVMVMDMGPAGTRTRLAGRMVLYSVRFSACLLVATWTRSRPQ